MSTWSAKFDVNLSSSQAWFNDWRMAAKNVFEQVGLPHSKQDNWKYAPLKQVFAQDFQEKNTGHFKPSNFPLDSHAVLCKNQKTFLDALGNLPKGVVVMPLVDAVEEHPELVKKYLGQIAKNRHGFIALNSGLFQAGVFIYLPKNVKLEKPILIHHQSEHGIISHVRNLVVCEADSSLHLIEYFDSADDHQGLINQVTEVFLQQFSNCQHLKIQNLSTAAMLQSDIYVLQQQESSFESFILQLGAHYASCDAHVEFQGEHSQASLNGVFKASEQQIHQQRLNIEHAKPHCKSSQNFRGILDDHAHGVFIGQVLVDKDAIKTEAHQSNKNLLLSKYAQMTTCPQLQIFADDVICSHGATVGQLDEDAIFYLQTRGVQQEAAKDLLVHAFIQEPIDCITSENFKQCCMDYLSKK
jgi:Fe-S cluster assembly protein SufD